MRKLLPITLLSLSVLVLLALRRSSQPIAIADRADQEAIGCAPPAYGIVRPDEQGKFAPLFTGWGHYSYKVHTNNDSAQLYFNQGLNLYYSYHLTEALASFKEAARFDPECTMAYWGQALSMGPYYNSYIYKMPAGVLPVLEQMNRTAANAPSKEKALVSVMGRRYSRFISSAAPQHATVPSALTAQVCSSPVSTLVKGPAGARFWPEPL